MKQEKAENLIRVRGETLRMIQRAKLNLRQRSYDNTIYYLLKKFQSDWEGSEIIQSDDNQEASHVRIV